MRELRALKKITTRPPAYGGGPRLPRQSGAERRARLQDGRCPVHGRVFDLQHQASIGTVLGRCTRAGCGIWAVVEEGTWKLPPATVQMLDDNHLDDVDALVTLARCIGRSERRISDRLRTAIDDELSRFAAAWVEEDGGPDEVDGEADRDGAARESLSP